MLLDVQEYISERLDANYIFFLRSQSSKLIKSFNKRKNKSGLNVTFNNKLVKLENPELNGAGATASINYFSIAF